ncbi:carboxypeptidase-like regulatory domain-containing protein [Marinigracilibium pacificum]|uniref:Carboxypeptidase-like regulatory domain-containing protein n=1 Tax=Marinigracilibium pacificum TaxID=2729599 RepID=A0A848J3W8_9BACT|nr:carboxypeptidase-like regulatory domain-containing protein [Marinigracilibium pacificum]NMM49049.1 carboxypeptidase-like regulatory domain-containing protein [Marinigracilibium pacificum]
MKNHIFLSLIFFISFSLVGQNKTYLVQILDNTSGEPVPFANVMFEDLFEGTNANENGFFRLVDSQKYLGRNVIISCVGYKDLKISYNELIIRSTIRLIPDTKVLNEVMVSAEPEKPVDIMKKVIDFINQTRHLNDIHYYNIDSEVSDFIDTLHISTINQVVDIYDEPIVHIIGVQPYDKPSFKKLSYYASYPWNAIINNNINRVPVFEYEKLDYFVFSYNFDSSSSRYLKIDFNAIKHSRKVLNTNSAKDYSGSLIVDIESYQLKSMILNIEYENGSYNYTRMNFDLIKNELIPLLTIERRKIEHVLIVNHTNWLKSEENSGKEVKMNHDLEHINPSEAVFENYNNFVR